MKGLEYQIFTFLLTFVTGLVILEATYGPSPDKEAAGLDVDVTTSLRALVHNGQLYISSRTPKVVFFFWSDGCIQLTSS